jgi:membrane carboxypeptidase/penicillin-binding protein
MRRIGKWLLWLLLALLVMLVCFETWAVFRARAHTTAVLEEVRERPLRLENMPLHRVVMLLRVEDPGFFAHRGVDFSTPGAGMTTITQALVKRFYFDGFRPGFAKLEQSLIARFVLDPAMSKRDQLEVFINYASFGTARGRDIVGFAAAAEHYYQRPLAALSDREFLSLVAMLMAPNALDPVRHPAENAERVRRIEAMLADRCVPRGFRDVSYEDCAGR